MTGGPPPRPDEPGPSGNPRSLPFDTTVAHQARMYDYLLGGKDHYAADREAVEAWLKVDPSLATSCRANRAFLGRAVRFLAGEAGIRQFLDIGTGIPTSGNTHEVAQAIAPESRVVYVDYDPIVLAHARALLTSETGGATEYIDADLRDTDRILAQARTVLDFSRPVAVTLLAILHVISDADDPHAIVAKVMDALPSGSYLVVSHAGSDLLDRQTLDSVEDIVTQLVHLQPGFRSREEVGRFFAGTDLVEPGLVRVEQWRPGQPADGRDETILWCAIGRKQ
ncbi:MAG TPA: SAM-dependent methyltransferase [Trebonia sp.]|nr:SAM-dependent methyltransferase [Trebonia sp.]